MFSAHLFTSYLGTEEGVLQELTETLHNLGLVVWHNVPKLRNIVIINPQWLADAMAGVVSFVSQTATAKQTGMTSWIKMQESLKLKYVITILLLSIITHYYRFIDSTMHVTILRMLEYFEIIYHARTVIEQANVDQMFFVPSLLSLFSKEPDSAHQYWQEINFKYVSNSG